jgi:hypothetical protein
LLLKFLQSISLQLSHKLGCFSAQQIPQLPKLCQKKLLGFQQGLQLSSSSSSSTDLVRPPICVHQQERSWDDNNNNTHTRDLKPGAQDP